MAAHWLSRLQQDEIVLLDGGTGSELRRRGVPIDPVVWSARASLEHRAVLEQIHRDYIEAGAEIITANTFAATRFVLEAGGQGGAAGQIVQTALAAAREARRKTRADRVAIAGSLSCLPPRFDPAAYPDPVDERHAYGELARQLAEAGADLLLLEMLQDTAHGNRALDAAFATGLPVILGLSARRSRAQPDTLVGFDYPDRAFEPVLVSLLARPPAVVAIMHTPPDAVGPALGLIRRHWAGPMGAYPELGQDPAAEASQTAAALGPDAFVAAASGWVAKGARLLGGCCETGPAHIRALHEARSRLARVRQA